MNILSQMKRVPGDRFINDYVGIPWMQGGSSKDGADCWGLVLLVSREYFGIDIGIYEGATYTGEELGNIIGGELRSLHWLKIDTPINGDVVTMTAKGDLYPSHVGIVVNGKVLHSIDTTANGASSIHPMKTIKRLFKKVEVHRYVNDNHIT